MSFSRPLSPEATFAAQLEKKLILVLLSAANVACRNKEFELAKEHIKAVKTHYGRNPIPTDISSQVSSLERKIIYHTSFSVFSAKTNTKSRPLVKAKPIEPLIIHLTPKR